ncbi:hypothetical protein IW261DRAFT_1480294 [Armillaria novae-zelandiae]|uniref:HNH nuclease domain-containing protein n=1 Tax=Armillaria novae-zelandiae TaxID=153914 RepID=A0AA39P8L6_9AGAR|nr:hypothetical protein IW261DRAFT_1480294 [Armillaria novae-zelandiae]
MPERLPSNDYPLGSNEHAAYQSCLVLEALGSSCVVAYEAAMLKFIPQVVARVLGYALRHSPSVEGKAHLVQEILDCNNNGEFLAGFKNPKASVPTSLSITTGNTAAAVAQPTISSSKAKDLALARDNYRCTVSEIVDLVKVAASTSLGHIFGQSMMDHTAGVTRAARAKLEWAATAAAVIERFAGIPILEELNQNDIHRPENTFTIADGLHAAFDRLSFSLCPIDESEDDNNTYEIHTHPPNRNASDAHGCNQRKNPLPDHRYFQLHHACVTIAHLSGAGEVVEQLFRDMEDVKVLAEDGGSNHLLSLVLSSRLQALSVY